MKLRLILTYLLLAAIFPAWSATPDTSIIARADSAYSSDDYTTAASLYRQAIDSLGPSSDLYYNLGNTWFRLGKSGQAVVAYERALRLDPTNSDAKANLAFVNSKLIDRPGDRGTLVGNIIDRSSLALHSNEWAWIAFGAFMVFLGAVALYMFCPSVRWRKAGFFGGFAVLIFTVFAGFMSARNAAISQADDVAVITVPSTILSTSPREPRERSEEAILLHEGTRMQILDSVTTTTDSVKSTWVDVQVDNRHRAWINRSAIEII